MRILVACEESQTVMKAFRKRGHDAYSCDLQPCSGGWPEFHLLGDVRGYLDSHWDLIIAHPTCKYLTNAGVRWLHDDPLRWINLYEGCEFFNLFLDHPCERIAIENPIPHKYALGWLRRGYNQVIQPWHFGHEEQKATCFWLKGLPKLEPTNIVGPPPKDPEERKAWAKCHRMAPGPEREKLRSKTYTGIAEAMAEQWGIYETIAV